MLKRALVVIAVALVFTPSSLIASAVLIDAKGKVSVILPGKEVERAKVGMELPDGSIVNVTDGGASVLLESGTLDEIASKTTYTVGVKSDEGKRTDLGGGIALAMRELAATGEGPTVHGMVKEAKGPRDLRIDFGKGAASSQMGLFPTGTKVVLGESQSFRWSRPVDYANAVLVLDDAKRNRLAIANLKRGDTSFTRSSAKLHLTKGNSYSWYLGESAGDGIKGRTGRFVFQTLAASDESSLNSKKGRIDSLKMGGEGKDLLKAQLYFQYGLYDDMVKALRPIYEKSRAPFVKKLMRFGYTKMGNNVEAAKYK